MLLAEELEIPAHFQPDPVHIRRNRKQFTYQPIQNPKEKLKVNFFFAILDSNTIIG